MTEQYAQPGINQLDAEPIAVQTTSITAITEILGALEDGQSLTVRIFGGGSAPGALAANNYVVNSAQVTFVREAGVGSLTPFSVPVLSQVGGPVALSFVVDDVSVPGQTICRLSIGGPAFPYDHRLKVSKIQF